MRETTHERGATQLVESHVTFVWNAMISNDNQSLAHS